jgi:hypothetical protein
MADFYVRPATRKPPQVPFNGQAKRREIFLELVSALEFRAIVETGTYRGSTTDFLATASHVSVHTAEAASRYYHYARLRFRRRPDIRVFAGDSRRLLHNLATDAAFPKSGVFFYLDAHWYQDLPLREELEIITSIWENSVVMIDDFAVPGDEGYGYDDYGPGKRLDLEYLGPVERQGWSIFFPAASSAMETGWKRGCVVLSQRGAAERLRTARLLRPYPTSGTA